MTSAVIAKVDLFEGFVDCGDSYSGVMRNGCLSMGLFRRDERFVSSRSEISVTNIIDQRDRVGTKVRLKCLDRHDKGSDLEFLHFRPHL